MSGEIRRGKSAIQEAKESTKGSGGGSFKPFLPSIFWSQADEERYLLLLTPIEDSPQFDMITWIPTESGYPEMAVAKTDPYFGERYDPFVEDWDATPSTKNIAIAVELEPILENIGGRKKPTGFKVKTKEFTRKIYDDEGEPTEETEEVTTPVVGVITQSPNNFFGVLKSVDDTEFPVHQTPVKITRVGKDQNTQYNVIGYENQELDLSNLFEHLDGVTYLGEDLEPLQDEVQDVNDKLEAAHKIGEVLLDKRLTELLDDTRYQELFDGVTESMDRFGNKKNAKKAAPKAKAKPVAKEEKPEKAVKDSDAKARLSELRKRAAEKAE